MATIRSNGDSFGEAYHVCAAAIVDATVKWRVTEGKCKKVAEQFLGECAANRLGEDQGSSPTKATRIVAAAFKERGAQRIQALLANRWLARGSELSDRTGRAAVRLLGRSNGHKVLIWNRTDTKYDCYRNTAATLLNQLVESARRVQLIPVVTGQACKVPEGAVDLTEFWNSCDEVGPGYFEQLAFIDETRRRNGVVAALGNRSGAMDGPALLGCPTMYFDNFDENPAKQKRMLLWTNGNIPNYTRQLLSQVEATHESAELRSLDG